jgi:citrate lyase subunit beta/citryl-CoA lyase
VTTAADAATPLTWLYAPGDRPDVVRKALGSGADVVVIDLEDAVAADRKRYALDAAADILADTWPVPVHVRINALDGPLAEREARRLARLPGLAGLRLPKVTGPADLARVAAWTGAPVPPLYPLLENAVGVERAFEIATAGWPRARAVVAARAAGLPAPAQSVYPDVRDEEGLARSCAAGRALGFLGRAAIHPRQLPVIERAYLPTEAEVASAREIVRAAATDDGALALPDGRFVDPAVVAGARRTLALARRAGAG